MIGIDTGGTYTDAVLFDETQGVLACAKSLTTKHDLSLGVRAAVEAVLSKPLPDIRLVSISTTLATNAIVEGQGSAVGLILIGQRADALDRADLRRALAGDPVVALKGGHHADGREIEPLDLDAAEAAILELAPRVSAFAVAGYFAVRNAEHERAIRDLVRERTGLPVTCSHELSSNLDAPRRALTAVLNARLIPLLQELIVVVQEMLNAWSIDAPVMVVMGDGSLISSDVALARPVETILSGPAASVIGARYLCGESDGYVVDIGGTTTDIALLENGWPALNLEGAIVAGWRTMVQAVSVHTVGIGGDSEVRIDDDGELIVGPRRALPLSLLVRDFPHLLEILKLQLLRGYPRTQDGRFALRQRLIDGHPEGMTSGETRVWQALEAGPISVEKLMSEHPLERQLERLIRKGLVLASSFTPSDAAHVLNRHTGWSREAAQLGAQLWARRDSIKNWESDDDATEFSELVLEQLIIQSGETLIGAALMDQLALGLDTRQTVARTLIRRSLRKTTSASELLDVRVNLHRPIIAIGAPASTYYPEIAKRLGCQLEIPEHAEVCNAVGAVASGVMQSVKVTITSPAQGRYRIHFDEANEDFCDLDEAIERAESQAGEQAIGHALAAGAEQPQLKLTRNDTTADLGAGETIFLESEVVATAVGRPRLKPLVAV